MTNACSSASDKPAPAAIPAATTNALDKQIRQFAPVDLSAPVDALPPNEADALRHIIEAARLMDGLFLEQVWSGNAALQKRLESDTSAEGRAELHYFLINKGPWSRLDHNAVFVRKEFGVPEKPGQANFYPADATRDEVDKWIGTLKGDAHDKATGFFSVIRRGADGKFTIVPYNVDYRTR